MEKFMSLYDSWFDENTDSWYLKTCITICSNWLDWISILDQYDFLKIGNDGVIYYGY